MNERNHKPKEVIPPEEEVKRSQVKKLCVKALENGEFNLKFKSYPHQKFNVDPGYDADNYDARGVIRNDSGDSAIVYASVNLKTGIVSRAGKTQHIVNYPSID